MKEENKFKEWMQMAGLTALCLAIGFHLNSKISPNKTQDAPKQDADRVERVDSVAPRDTITTVNNVRAARKVFLDGINRSLPLR